MNKYFYLMLLISLNSYSQELDFNWKKVIGISGHSEGITIDSDSTGNIYVAGSFENELQDNVLKLNSTNAKDGFLIKYDSLGNIIWDKQFKCLYDCSINSIQIKDDNLFVLGNYRNKIQFDTILITNNSDTLYSSNIFLCNFKLDGELVWAKNTGGISFSGNKLCVASDENIFITGKSIDIQYFDTTSMVNTLDSIWDSTPFGSYWSYFHPVESFLAKYDKEGNKIWVKNIGGHPYFNCLDSQNNIIISGNYYDTEVFDSIDLEPLGTETIFLAKYDSNGKVKWVKRSGGSSNWNIGKGIVTDNDNNIYQTGEMSGNAITFGETMISGFESTSGFLTKYNNLGDLIWIKQIGLAYNEGGGENFIRGNSLKIDMNGNINLTGYFQGVININDYSLISSGAHDLMLLKYDSNGNILAGGQYTNTGWSAGNDLVIFLDGNIYMAGYTYLDEWNSSSTQYIFIAQVDDVIPTSPLSIIENNQLSNQITIFPNPSHGTFTLRIPEGNIRDISRISIYNIVGERLIDSNKIDITQNINIQQKGTYLVQIIIDKEIITKKLVVH